MPKEFSTTTGKKRDRRTAEFVLDGVTLHARAPKTAALLELVEAVSDNGEPLQQVRAARVFIDDCLDVPSREHIEARLVDPEDDLEFNDLVPILEWMTEEFLTRPTPPSSASASTRSRTGRASTARSHSKALIPSASPQNGS